MPGAIFTFAVNPQLEQQFTERRTTLDYALCAYVGDVAYETRWRVARRTPVLKGVARAHWRITLFGEGPERFDKSDVDPTGENGNAEAREMVRAIQLGMMVSVVNAAPYILRLNNGWSKKAPAGFIDQTWNEVPYISQAMLDGLRDRLHGRGAMAGPTLGRAP